MDIKIEKIIQTNRKMIALQITDNATLIVRAPLYVTDDEIMNVVYRHQNWIKKKKEEIKLRKSSFSPKEFVDGEGFLYLGKYYRLN
jgi:predicted metal-dependent hydrolase